MKQIFYRWCVLIFLLTSCGQSTPTLAPTNTIEPATSTSVPTATSVPATATPLPLTETLTPAATQDSTIFGSIGVNEIQASTLESVATAIFKKTMDSFVASDSITDYKINGVTVLPGDEYLLAEIKYNVKTTNPSWLADGGTPTATGWINGNCARLDLIITDTEFQLTKRRACG